MKIVFRDLRTMIHTGRDMGAHEARSVPGAHSRRFPGGMCRGKTLLGLQMCGRSKCARQTA